MIENIKDYIKDLEFRFTIYPNRLYIVNYSKIVSLKEDKLIIIGAKRKYLFKGQHFSLNKLLDSEVLILGEVVSLEVENE